MAKKNNNSNPIPSALEVDRANFKEILAKRIALGKQLYDKSITTVPELEQHQEDYRKWDDYNSEYLKLSFNIPNSEYKYDYDTANISLGVILGNYDDSPNARLKELKKDIKNKLINLEQLLAKSDLLRSNVEVAPVVKAEAVSATVVKGGRSNNIFVVHGQNDNVKVSVARTIEKLGLNPIILHEQPNSGKTIIEKFEKYSDVRFAIILLTDDDEGKSKVEVDLKKRARQNVILEMGYFIGKLGRSRIVPLYSEGVELPSDLYGIVYVPIDKAETWKFYLVKELKEAGYEVDANKLL